MVNYELIGQRVRDLRENLGYTQEQLAELAGFSTPFVSHIENALKKLSLDALIRFAEALGTTTDNLLTGNQSSEANAYMEDTEALLSDCSTPERRIVLEVARAVKKALHDSGWAA